MYYTTKGTASENGTGLGLKLCKHFLEKNGGEISVKSSPGEGSIFSFTLPRYVSEN
jgi:two-component system, sensor histidine kinase and response regulator